MLFSYGFLGKMSEPFDCRRVCLCQIGSGLTESLFFPKTRDPQQVFLSQEGSKPSTFLFHVF